ncbi:ATP-binding protein [Pseudomonas japonica]|uniref:histidine kinase n=1 Tax=Pseudomonas japonica TaxID=256466 RepID=A0A239EQY1_9PSED|nr:ATP-binding protein [Pseudomonas japonica]SNS46433.1 PAS/PAC sensor hybrid histidine kinase [Pseudomonas japonica]
MHIIHLAPRPVLQGGMSEAVRQFDWSRTSLGPLHRWPSSLRIAVDLMLASRFPSCLVWGSDMVTLHNDAFVPILGTKPSPLGRPFHEVWSDVWGELGALVFRVMEGEAVFLENFPLITSRNGVLEQVYFTFSFSPVRDESGRVAGFLDTLLETTSNVESERQWRELAGSFERQVQERTADHNRLWELSSDLMLVVQDDLRLRTFNPACRQLLGWDDDQQRESLLTLLHPDDRDAVRGILDGAQPAGEGRLRHADGHYRRFTLSAMPGAGFTTLLGHDVTLDREREAALRQAEALLRHGQKMDAVGQLTGGMAHDFNNLLAGLNASLEMLERRIVQGRTEQIGKYLQAARQASDRACELTHRLLAFARRQPLSPRPTNLNDLLGEIEPLILQAIGPGIDLQLQVDPRPWWVLVDTSQMESALINLCANARDAMNRRGSLKISTSNERHYAGISNVDLAPGDYCCLRVQDCGHGMPVEVLERVFDPFFSTKPAGQGTGLGLSMVYGFVRQSGGSVRITSEEGSGTCVELLLPRFVGEPQPLPVPQVPAAPLPMPMRHERILLIDDEPTLRMLIREALQDQGMEVLEADDAHNGLALYDSAGPIDLVVSDIGLPGGVSGIDVAKTLRQRSPDQRILFITGFTEESLSSGGVLEPGLELLTKPFGLDSLVHKVTSMLQPEQPPAEAPKAPPR